MSLDYYHLSEHLYQFAHLLCPDIPERITAWVEEKLAALLTDRIGGVLGALKRMRPRQPTVRDGLGDLLHAAYDAAPASRHSAPGAPVAGVRAPNGLWYSLLLPQGGAPGIIAFSSRNRASGGWDTT